MQGGCHHVHYMPHSDMMYRFNYKLQWSSEYRNWLWWSTCWKARCQGFKYACHTCLCSFLSTVHPSCHVAFSLNLSESLRKVDIEQKRLWLCKVLPRFWEHMLVKYQRGPSNSWRQSSKLWGTCVIVIDSPMW